MPLRSKRKFLLACTAGLALVGGILAAGCSGDGESEATANAGVVNAINILDNGGLHAIDESINKDKTIPATAKTTAQKLQAVTELTEWPDELQDEADALAKVFADMVTALNGDSPDMTKAGEAAKKAHDAQHDFSHEVWAHLYEEAGISTGDEGGGH
jgi:hypothetical protein